MRTSAEAEIRDTCEKRVRGPNAVDFLPERGLWQGIPSGALVEGEIVRVRVIVELGPVPSVAEILTRYLVLGGAGTVLVTDCDLSVDDAALLKSRGIRHLRLGESFEKLTERAKPRTVRSETL